jgi:hypothetical protein
MLFGHLTIMTAWPDHTCEMDQSGDLVSRKAESLVTEALADTRVVTLNGARQAGKSTLARITAMRYPNTVVRLLDDPATLRAALHRQQALPFGDRLRPSHRCPVELRTLTWDTGDRRRDGALRTQSLPFRPAPAGRRLPWLQVA